MIEKVLRNLTEFESECFLSNIKLFKIITKFKFEISTGNIISAERSTKSSMPDYIHSHIQDDYLYISTNCYYMLYNLLFACYVEKKNLSDIAHLHFKCRMNDINTSDLK